MSENKKEGFIPIYRSMFRHWIWDTKEPFDKRSAWIDLIRSAKFEPGEAKKMFDGKLITYKKSEIVASVRFLQNRWNWKSTTKVENFLENLKKDGMINTEKRQGITVITICNYCTYNDFIKTENTAYYEEQIRWQYEQNTIERHQKDETNNLTIEQVNNKTNNTPIGVQASDENLDNFVLDKSLGVDFVFVMKYIQSTSFVKKLPKILTAKEYSKLREDYEQVQILEMLEKMENSKSIKTKQSVYLTLLNYLKLNFGNAEILLHYEKFETRYREFVIKISNGEITSPKIEQYDKTELRSTIEFLKENSNDKSFEGAYKSWEYILSNWTMLDVYMQNRTKLREINSDIMKIINSIKNAKSKQLNKANINTASNTIERKDY